MLTPLVVVVMDELFDSNHQFLVGFKSVEIVHFAFQDAPKALHWAVVEHLPTRDIL